MIVIDLLDPEVEDLEIRTQDEELQMGESQDVIVAEDDPVIPPFSPPGV